MWEKPTHRTVEGTARPLRVAYLVDLSKCEHLLLDKIFAESFSRWSGRRTPIIPASRDGIDPAYDAWLYAFDADIIYSFADLTDEAIAKLDEKYAPGILHHHEAWYRDPEDDRRYNIELPIQGLSSLSVLPMAASQRWGLEGKPQNILSFDRFWDGSSDAFLGENFGFLSTSFGRNQLSDSAPELFTCLTLISEEALNNRHLGKSPHAKYETDASVLLEALAEPGAVLPPNQLSELFCHYLDPENSLKRSGVNVVVGDEIADRLVFWNGHNRYPRNELTGTSSLRISVEQARDTEFLRLMGRVIDRRGVLGDQNDPVATIRSTSLVQDELEDIAERMAGDGKPWKRFDASSISEATWAIPEFRKKHTYIATSSLAFSREPRGQQKTELTNGRAALPLARPWHLSETIPPPSFRSGQWMVDFVIEREQDHCQLSNVVHTWVLPRRIRIDPLFSIERNGSSPQLHPRYFQRPTRLGNLSASTEFSVRQASLTVPNDEDAFWGALSDVQRERFFRGTKSDNGDRKPPPPKIFDLKYSDKGRYLLGALQHFESLQAAFKTLMHDFWRETLRELGANPSHLSDSREAEFQRIMGKRLRAGSDSWTVSSQGDRHTVAKEALRIASQIPRSARYITHKELATRHEDLVSAFFAENAHLERDYEDDYLSTPGLDVSIQYLCERNVLFQGHEWRCRNCYNRNWVSIEDLRNPMTCNVCGNTAPPPVSGGWHFKASGFFVEAYSDHGTEPAIWALWKLADRAKSSFYYLPSILVWFDNFREDSPNDCEVDLIVVLDGETIAVEATTSTTLSTREIKKLADFATRIRPDRFFVVCGARDQRARDRLKAKISSCMPEGVNIEVATYQRSSDRLDPYLPH